MRAAVGERPSKRHKTGTGAVKVEPGAEQAEDEESGSEVRC